MATPPTETALDTARRADKGMARRLETLMRSIDKLEGDQERAIYQKRTERMAAMASVAFLGGGIFTMYAGYKAAHPLWCPIRPWVKNNTICKILSPLCCMGMFITGVAMYQFPGHLETLEAVGQRHATINRDLMRFREERQQIEGATGQLAINQALAIQQQNQQQAAAGKR